MFIPLTKIPQNNRFGAWRLMKCLCVFRKEKQNKKKYNTLVPHSLVKVLLKEQEFKVKPKNVSLDCKKIVMFLSESIPRNHIRTVGLYVKMWRC